MKNNITYRNRKENNAIDMVDDLFPPQNELNLFIKKIVQHLLSGVYEVKTYA